MFTLVGRLTDFPSNYKKGLKQTCENGLSMTEIIVPSVAIERQ